MKYPLSLLRNARFILFYSTLNSMNDTCAKFGFFIEREVFYWFWHWVVSFQFLFSSIYAVFKFTLLSSFFFNIFTSHIFHINWRHNSHEQLVNTTLNNTRKTLHTLCINTYNAFNTIGTCVSYIVRKICPFMEATFFNYIKF